MNDYLIALLLGVVEGLTEFLPVSSTAHLRMVQAALGLDLADGYWKMYAIVIQLGAILCLPIYFRHRIARFVRTFPSGPDGDGRALTHPLTLTFLAFLVTAVPSFLLSKVIGENLESLFVMGVSLVAGGIVMWVVDAYYGQGKRAHTLDIARMGVGQAVWVGACQVLAAVFPGTSRSMATIAAGQTAGMSRQAALEFSFFISMPTMAAATIYDLLKSVRDSYSGAETIGSMPANAHQWIVLGIGFVVSFFVAYAVVAWFMNWVRSRGFVPFAIYRILLGLAVLAWAL